MPRIPTHRPSVRPTPNSSNLPESRRNRKTPEYFQDSYQRAPLPQSENLKGPGNIHEATSFPGQRTSKSSLIAGHFPDNYLHLEKELNNFLKGEIVEIPTPATINPHGYFDDPLDKDTLIRRHAGLLSGVSSSCLGTTEVAGWVAHVMKQIGTTKDLKFCSSMEKREIGFKFIVAHQLATDLQKLRNVCRSIRFTAILHPEIDDDDWKATMLICSLSVLSKLREHKEIIIPSDFFCLLNEANGATTPGNKAKIDTAHATTVVMKLLNNEGDVEIVHIETNGYDRPLITNEAATRLRLNSIPATDRAKKISQGDLLKEDQLSSTTAINSLRRKGFLQKTYYSKFESLAETPAKLHYVTKDAHHLLELLFPDHGVLPCGLATMSSVMAIHIADTFGPSTLEPQRIFKTQGTDSCELKSTTVALNIILNDELAYQNLLFGLLQRAKDDLNLINKKTNNDQDLKKVLLSDINRLEERLADAARFR